MDPSTVIWWLKRSSEARSAIVNDDAIPLHDALLQFGEFIFENIPGGRKKHRSGEMVHLSIIVFCVLHLISSLKNTHGNTGMIAMFEQL